jgi:hypothetical protein
MRILKISDNMRDQINEKSENWDFSNKKLQWTRTITSGENKRMTEGKMQQGNKFRKWLENKIINEETW